MRWKTSWKTLYVYVDKPRDEYSYTQNEDYSDAQFMQAASYLHRQFLLNLDIFQRDLFYHRRYVSYCLTHATNPTRYIVPTLFIPDLKQEDNALAVLDLRLKAIRNRTTTILEMVSLMSRCHCVTL